MKKKRTFFRRDKKASSNAPKPKPSLPPSEEELKEGMRLNKYIAHCGICSRRKAAEYIEQGLVTVNGTVVKEMGHRVMEADVVTYQGKVVKPEQNMVYLLLNKPKHVITTLKDEKGRTTVMDLLKGVVPERIFPVGRLDRATTGLLLLTNDGELAKTLAHPSHEVDKIYHVVLDRPVDPKHLEQIRAGITLEDGPVPVDQVDYVKGAERNEIGIEVHIGRNRIVRRIFEHFKYEVKRLDRTYYAGLTKKKLPRGKYRFLTKQEVIMLKHFRK